MNTRDPTSRLRANLNPLRTTALGHGFHAPGPGPGPGPGTATPLSTVSTVSTAMLSPFASAGPPPASAATPASAIQPYNPQQWIPSTPLERYEAAPLPPPPYSPPRSQRPPSAVYDAMPSPPVAGVTSTPAATTPPANPTFAPPPGTASAAATARGASRDRRFGLPSFGRRREQDAATDLHTPPPQHAQHARHASASHHHARPPPLQLAAVAAVPPPPPGPPPLATTTTEAVAGPGIVVPPASRRAASTGAIGTPTSARSRSASQVRWEPGMPLPPPPPGPPPAASAGGGSRSQSLTRGVGGGSVPMLSPPTRRPPPAGVTVLGPVPPTPANWVEEGAGGDQAAAAGGAGTPAPPPPDSPGSTTPPQDTPDSSVLSSGGSAASHESGGGGGNGGVSAGSTLFRAGAVRGEKTLRERRNESRTRPGTAGGGSVRSSLDGAVMATATATTPTAAAATTPHALSDILIPSPHTVGSMLQRRATGRRSGGTPVTAPGTAPATTPATTTPAPTPPTITRDAAVRQTAEQFRDGTLARLQAFAAGEAAAATDADRVRLFAAFVVGESRVRRERYAAAIGAMGSDLLDLTRDLFRPMAVEGTPAGTPAISSASASSAASPGFSDRTPGPDTPLSPPTTTTTNSAPPSAGGRPLSSSNYYMPSLSPILSMSVASEHPSGKGKRRGDEEDDDNEDDDDDDELNSRGRAPSRWWEASDHGNDRTTDRGRLERSRRESKYMGVPKEQWAEADATDAAGSSHVDYSALGPDEYPPEKGQALLGEAASTPLAGEYQADPARTPQASAQHFGRPLLSASAPGTPHGGGPGTPASPSPAPLLDVSRLVTLPPPYPRHHPAVNNSHPELAATRAAVRRLADLADADAVRAQFARARRAADDAAAADAAAAQAALHARLQAAVAAGTMGYAAAAAEEAAAATAAAAARKAAAKAAFDAFQRDVVAPVHGLLTQRLADAEQLYGAVVARLARAANPHLPQEAGDEQPELLETLTLLKWLFDAREGLHRAVFDVLSERNDRYREMVLAPYREAAPGVDPGSGSGSGPASDGTAAKLRDAEAFFAADAAARARAEAAAAAARAAAFCAVAEDTVARGAEAQLSAFWDIAPALARLLDRIPAATATADLPPRFGIAVPAAELAETPSYRAHPLQYLFGLLLHAEKSTHQFIESQTNLFCLLNEIQELALAAAARAADPDTGEIDTAAERARLTAALQDKVRVVQDQWRAGLGDSIARVKERVGGWLLETGGWDESLEEGGVGSV